MTFLCLTSGPNAQFNFNTICLNVFEESKMTDSCRGYNPLRMISRMAYIHQANQWLLKQQLQMLFI